MYTYRLQVGIYRIRGNFRGMKFSLNRKQAGFSRLYFRGSQIHCGKVACYVLLQISNCCKLANFHGLNFCCISRWPRNPRNLHTAEISVRTVYTNLRLSEYIAIIILTCTLNSLVLCISYSTYTVAADPSGSVCIEGRCFLSINCAHLHCDEY